MPLRKSVSETEIPDYKSEGKDDSSQSQTKAEGFPVTYCRPKAEPKNELENEQGLSAWGYPGLIPPLAPEVHAGDFLTNCNLVGGFHSCIICGRAHSDIVCGLKKSCPIDQKVGDGFIVVCVCNNVVIDGKCPLNCGSTWGRAGYEIPRDIPMYNLPDFQEEHKNN